jgi:putative membrane protein
VRCPSDGRRPRSVYRTGSEPDPRFSLANERTLLAWLRTSLAFVVTGIAIIALREVVRQPSFAVMVAGAACAVGAIAAVGAYLHWMRVERALRLGRPLPPPNLALVVVAGVLALALVAVIAAVVIER